MLLAVQRQQQQLSAGTGHTLSVVAGTVGQPQGTSATVARPCILLLWLLHRLWLWLWLCPVSLRGT